MKKLLALLLVATMVFCVSACTTESAEDSSQVRLPDLEETSTLLFLIEIITIVFR